MDPTGQRTVTCRPVHFSSTLRPDCAGINGLLVSENLYVIPAGLSWIFLKLW